jgi:hypothetical protein
MLGMIKRDRLDVRGLSLCLSLGLDLDYFPFLQSVFLFLQNQLTIVYLSQTLLFLLPSVPIIR